jgi:hypothetical protein
MCLGTGLLCNLFKAILRLGGNSLKVECDGWYGRNLDAEQRDDGLKCIKDEKRLALVEQYNTIKVYIRSSMIR